MYFKLEDASTCTILSSAMKEDVKDCCKRISLLHPRREPSTNFYSKPLDLLFHLRLFSRPTPHAAACMHHACDKIDDCDRPTDTDYRPVPTLHPRYGVIPRRLTVSTEWRSSYQFLTCPSSIRERAPYLGVPALATDDIIGSGGGSGGEREC